MQALTQVSQETVMSGIIVLEVTSSTVYELSHLDSEGVCTVKECGQPTTLRVMRNVKHCKRQTDYCERHSLKSTLITKLMKADYIEFYFDYPHPSSDDDINLEGTAATPIVIDSFTGRPSDADETKLELEGPIDGPVLFFGYVEVGKKRSISTTIHNMSDYRVTYMVGIPEQIDLHAELELETKASIQMVTVEPHSAEPLSFFVVGRSVGPGNLVFRIAAPDNAWSYGVEGRIIDVESDAVMITHEEHVFNFSEWRLLMSSLLAEVTVATTYGELTARISELLVDVNDYTGTPIETCFIANARAVHACLMSSYSGSDDPKADAPAGCIV
jgi:hypothetical protein